MKKITTILMITALLFVFVGVASADVNAVTPSTNDINRTKNWAHVDEVSVGVGEVTLEFVSTRGFASCFEYRTDGDTSQANGSNWNSNVTDGLYPFYCQNNNSSTHTFYANEYVEIRMVFGAEGDERFDWTRFDVIPDTEAPIVTNVAADPNPASIGSSVTVTANVDDATTGGSKIASAEYNFDGGAWTMMDASDGAFDDASEDVSAIFTTPSEPGIYTLCVRGTDMPGNVSNSECTMFVVYDPSGGFVTGGGWIDSPPGAYKGHEFDNPTLVWNQDFSLDDSGWLDSDNDWYGNIIVASGTATFYGDVNSGPFSRFDGYRDIWTGTWTAEIKVYLDPAWASGQGFDYSVAASGSDGNHQRDYIFHVTKDTSTGGLFVAGSNNTNFAPRENLENINHYEVMNAGWYTFQHVFYDQGGALAVDLNLLDTNGNILFTETRYNAADLIPQEVGGNRYSWFTFINVTGGIAIDDHLLIVPTSPPGKATFGFVAKYKKGANVPDGNTEFQFKAGNLNFHSTSYEWLVVTGNDSAKFKGEGTINGQGNYKFQIWAGDGSPDTFRIKIWDAVTEEVVYDNGMNQEIGGGNIVVHTKK